MSTRDTGRKGKHDPASSRQSAGRAWEYSADFTRHPWRLQGRDRAGGQLLAQSQGGSTSTPTPMRMAEHSTPNASVSTQKDPRRLGF